MTRYFADAWYVIAIIGRTDQHHAAARRLARSLRPERVVTHDGVLMEVLAYYSAFGAELRSLAAGAVREAMRTMQVFPAGRDLFLAAVDLYEQRLDKEYSVVDCMSMMLMRAEGITHVLTNDHHFRQEGFQVLSDSP